MSDVYPRPALTMVSEDVVFDDLCLILRMTIIVCGGLVLARIIIRFSGRLIKKAGKALDTDTLSIIGLVLNVINTIKKEC